MIEAVGAALGLGGNIGDVRETFRLALNALGHSAGVAVLATSSLYRTRPWGPIAQPPFLNMAVLAHTTLSPHQLLDLCLEIERGQGRVREVRYGPRTLDIDILAYGDLAVADDRLALPHPRLLERAFALVPLAEIAPDLLVGGVRVADAAAGLSRDGIERVET
jgi:2-amino-4-hydroxy-6-hydroxymethyldihydropteridine diphosphokinase